MNAPTVRAWACASLSLIALTTSLASEKAFRGKITVESHVASRPDFERPCYLVLPEGSKLELLKDAKGDELIESNLQKLGYHLVADPQDAEVFVKIDFAQLPPFEAQVTFKGRAKIDYSHSASTRNYAATLAGGRYSVLGNPDHSREIGATGYVLDPEGKPIDIGQQEPYEVKIEEGEKAPAMMTLHPSVFQATAWIFDEENPDEPPVQLWSTTSYTETLIEEPLEEQIGELVSAAAKHLGKDLAKPKLIKRKSKPNGD